MKKTIHIILLLLLAVALAACDAQPTTIPTTIQPTTAIPTTSYPSSPLPTATDPLSEPEIYKLLVEAEELSGMQFWNGKLISEDTDLNLPFFYKGVEITYLSWNQDIISNEGVVTLPDECWVESRNQDGVTERPGLNDNWPIVVDVTMTYMDQVRTAKLMFIVAPAEGFTCNKYKG